MQRLIIKGGKQLSGELTVQGAKNSALPILAGCVLAGSQVKLRGIPELSDVYAACRILASLGVKTAFVDGTVTADPTGISSIHVPEELMRQMRSSIVFLGAVLGKTGACRLSFPGGCELGPRPIDMHLRALRQMGVKITEKYGELICECPHGIKGAVINLPFPSVGATENIMLCAALADGETVICNAAREPEIEDLAEFLRCCGARIIGGSSGTVRIKGVKELHGCEYTVMPDRICAATFMAAAAATGGEIVLKGARAQDLGAVTDVFRQAGCLVTDSADRIYLNAKKPLRAVRDIKTLPYPGFPTDAQAPVMAMLCKARGTSVITETIFSSRFRHVDELARMGADIKTEGRTAVVTGVRELYGTGVVAPDLRGGAALVCAALAAQGESTVTNICLIDRGYEKIEKTLALLGADIRRENC